MEVCRDITSVRHYVRSYRESGQTVALVPTMGFLHDGHMALVRAAQKSCDRVVVSIFVNPTQFGEAEDLDSYPRDEKRDLEMLRAANVDAVFVPASTEMYKQSEQTIVDTTKLSRKLIGKIRPGHFRGVATVVTKLFNIVQPDRAFFGEKDYQQLAVIKTMVRDLNIPLKVDGVPTVRESGGLAMSSRNVKLTPQDRAAAVVLSQALDAAQISVKHGISARRLKEKVSAQIAQETRAELQSVDVRDAANLEYIRGKITSPVVVLLAVRFGKVLLIDQKVLDHEGRKK